MKIKVIKNFYDREHDLVLREPGIELDVTYERAKELICKGVAEEIKPEESTEEIKPDKKNYKKD